MTTILLSPGSMLECCCIAGPGAIQGNQTLESEDFQIAATLADSWQKVPNYTNTEFNPSTA